MNPHLLPKTRSRAIMDAARGQDCTLRIASIYGLSCDGTETTVGCHLPVGGKGTGTKVTDLAVAFGCATCHRIMDGNNINEEALWRMLNALVETHAILVGQGIITVKGAKS